MTRFQGYGLGLDVSVSRRTNVSSRSHLGLGDLRLVPRPCMNSFLVGMQMAPYAVWMGFRRCKPML